MESPNSQKPKWYRHYYVICAILGLLVLVFNYQGGNDLRIILGTAFVAFSIFGYYELKRYGR